MSEDPETVNEEIPHLLVVDDSRLMRRAIGKILGNDYRITEASDGEEAWDILESDHNIRVVFSDLSMPNLDGFGLLKRIRDSDDPNINELPVIIITGADDDDETKHKALDNGASDFISKPFESVQLRTRAQTHVRLDQTHKKLNETTSELERQATTDRLTGLTNKKYFDAHIVKDLSYAKRHRRELTLIYLEVDNFHQLFLKSGKEIADSILISVAKICQSETRNEDSLARVGLAKLAFILPSANRIGAKRLADRINEEIIKLDINDNNSSTPSFTVNIGIAAIDINNSTSIEDILELAQKHLNTAISKEGNSIVIDDAIANKMPTTAEEQPAPLSTLPTMDTAIQLANSNESVRLKPYLALLLKNLLPLLKICNTHLKLNIDDAITKIENHLKK